MTIGNIEISESIKKLKLQLEVEQGISPSLRAMIEVLVLIVTLLVNRLGLNSSNSSKPPSTDKPNFCKKTKADAVEGSKRKAGGQEGHEGTNLKKRDKVDEIKEISIDRRTLPRGKYQEAGFESRQVLDYKVSLHVKEYRAEILEDERGKKYTAQFPEGVTKSVQYGMEIKSASVCLSQYQLVPLDRVKECLEEQVGLSISKGSIFNFNKEAYEKLAYFESWIKQQLVNAKLLHADETGINVNGKRIWLHELSNDKLTLYRADEKRGSEAMERMGVLPYFKGILVHDHWKPYYKYSCNHVLCNAHHLRELQRAWEQDGQYWAKLLMDLLLQMSNAVDSANGFLNTDEILRYTRTYQTILNDGKKDCPLPEQGKRKKSRARNLLERLLAFEADTLRFMSSNIIPFTNNQGERDIRMTKVQQKISGCFRSMEGADIFCRVRSYLSTAKKNGGSPTEALRLIFQGSLPDFVT